MAIFGEYTAEQISTIEYQINRGKALHKKIEDMKLGDIYNEEEIDKLSHDLDEIKAELKEALNAKYIFEAHLAAAWKHIHAAEEIGKKYGVKVDDVK